MKKKNCKIELNIFCVLGLYFIGVAIYSAIMLLFSSPVHYIIDEQLYIGMARSFHYDGNFAVGGELKDYGSILYSIIISVAYFFYSPMHIIGIMREINVIVCVSAIIPIYFLTKKMELSLKNQIFILGISMMIPEMMNMAYIMQEVLLYPVFMWAILFIYLDVNKKNISKWTILSALFLLLCYFTKTSALAFVVGYLLYLFFEFIMDSDSRKVYVYKCICIVMIFIGGLLIEKQFLNYCNRGFSADNHYVGQFMEIWPIDAHLFAEIAIGLVFYISYTLISMGICMTSSVLLKFRYKYNRLLLIMFITLIFEIVLCILCTENRGNLVPNKFCFRYIYYLFVPIFMQFMKDNEEFQLSIVSKTLMIVCPLVSFLFFVVSDNDISQGIMDADLFTLVCNISKNIWLYFGMFCSIIIFVVNIVLIMIINRKKIIFSRFYCRLIIIYCFAFGIINLVQLPYYNNEVVGGREIIQTASKIEQILEDKDYQGLVYLNYGDDYTKALVGSSLKYDVKCFGDIDALDDSTLEQLEKIENEYVGIYIGK